MSNGLCQTHPLQQTYRNVCHQQVFKQARGQLQCHAAGKEPPPPPPPPPGRNPASSQRMRNLGFGQADSKTRQARAKGQPQEQGSSDAKRTPKPGAPSERRGPRNPFRMGRGVNPETEAAVAKAISPYQGSSTEEEPWDDWARSSDGDGDWEDSAIEHLQTASYQERRRRAWEGRDDDGTPRDSFLRPMVDLQGAKARLGFDSEKAAVEIEEEFDENRWESQEALKYGAFLIGMPLLIGFTVSRLLADPFFELVLAYNPNAFALSDKSKVEGAHEVHVHEMRLRMDAAIGRAPPLTENELQIELRREAKHLEKQFKERSRQALLNVLSDGTSGSLIFGILLRKTEGRAHFFRTLARFSSGLSDTAKAFLIIAGTDILLGYHSEEGWTAALRMISEHYGMEAEDKPIYLFVAIVPVVMDAIFKYWIFKGLNRQNPAAAATLRSMDRH